MSMRIARPALLILYGLLLATVLLIPTEAAAQTTVKYVHTDVLGSVVAMTDASGTVVDGHREYEAYGQQLTPMVQDGPGYTGHVQDAATGLTYMQQRYYDPMIPRFLSVDPVTAYSDPVGQFHRYRYANNNPYKFHDPDGRLAFLIPVVIIAYRAYSAYDTVSSTIDNVQTIADPSASTDAKLAAGAEIAGGLLGGKVGRQAAGGAARIADKAADASRSGTRGASGELTTASGNRYHGNSTGSSASGGDSRAAMHPQTQQALDSVQNPSRSHGECCEIDSINKALNAGDDVGGATMGPVTLNESSRTIPACSTCREVKKMLGIE